jgi:hypothetical protein
MQLRAVHYAEGQWTFHYEDGACFVTNHQAQAELLADGVLPTNKYGRRVTSYIDPNSGCDII